MGSLSKCCNSEISSWTEFYNFFVFHMNKEANVQKPIDGEWAEERSLMKQLGGK